MASAYSKPKNFDNYVQPINTELVNFVLGSKQQKFDYNVAKVEQTLAQFGNLGLVRDEDKQYLADKINSTIDSLGDLSRVDWSDSNIERQITTSLKGVIDDKIINDIKLSRGVTNFQSDVQRRKEEADGTYNKANEMYALQKSGALQWLNGEADTYGNLEYTPFTDVPAKYMETLEDSILMKKGITKEVEDPDNPGRYIKTTHYGLTEEDIRQKVLPSLTAQERKQLEINSWAAYGDNAVQLYDEMTKDKRTKLETKRKNLSLNMEGKSEAEQAIAKEEINTINNQLNYINARKENPEQLHSFVGTEVMISGLAGTYAPVETERTYTTNQSYYKDIETGKKNIQNAMGGFGMEIDANQNKIADLSTTSLESLDEESLDDFSYRERTAKQLDYNTEQLQGLTNGLIGRLSDDMKVKFDESYKSYLEEAGLDDNLANKANFLIDRSENGKGNLLSAPEIVALKKNLRKYSKVLENRTSNFKETAKEMKETDIASIFNQAKQNPNLRVINDNGETISMASYLDGIDSYKTLTDAQKRNMFKSVYAGLTIKQATEFSKEKGKGISGTNEFNVLRLAETLGEETKELPMAINTGQIATDAFSEINYNTNFERLKKDMQLPKAMTKTQFDEHIKPIVDRRRRDDYDGESENWIEETLGIDTDGFQQRATTNIAATLGWWDEDDVIVIGGEGTQTREALLTAQEDKLYREVEDNLYNALDNKTEFNNLYEEKLKADAPFDIQSQAIIVESSGTREGEQVAAFEELIRQSGGNLSKKGGNLTVLDDGSYYRVIQTDRVQETKNGEVTNKETRREARILKEDVRGGVFESWIDTVDSADRMTAENTDEVTSSKVGFADSKTQMDYVYDLANMYGIQDERGLASFTSQGAKKQIIKSYPDIFEDPQAGGTFKNLLNKMVDNSHLFRINVKSNRLGTFDMQVQYQGEEDGKSTWKNLRSMPMNTDDITETVSMLDVSPQIFLYDYMNRLFADINNDGIEFVEEDLKTLTNLLST